MEFKAYERGWGPVPSATSMAIVSSFPQFVPSLSYTEEIRVLLP
jgi:hypothetical protein